MEKEVQKETNRSLNNLLKKRLMKKIFIISIIFIVLIASLLIFFYFKNPEKELIIGAEIEEILFNENGTSIFIKLRGWGGNEEIMSVKFIFKENDTEHIYETTEGIKEISVSFKKGFWIFKREKFKGVYDYSVSASDIGLESFENITEIGVVFKYKTKKGEEVESKELDTEKDIKGEVGGGEGGGGGGEGCIPQTWYADLDGDSFGNANSGTLSTCPPTPAGYSITNDDCNDTDYNVNPEANETCSDNMDNNCNNIIDELRCTAENCYNGIDAELVTICTCEDLQKIDYHLINNAINGNFILLNDINCYMTNPSDSSFDEGGIWNNGKGFDPIGLNPLNPPSNKRHLNGTFDGQGYKIAGLYINRSNEAFVGLFSAVSSYGLIKNIGLIDVNITGDSNVGGLVGGQQKGNIIASYVKGNIRGNQEVGGITGRNFDTGKITNCFAEVNVEARGVVGGLVGTNQGNITNCFSKGSVAETEIGIGGGLVGENQNLIRNSYSTADVNGTNNIGGLVGYNFKAGNTPVIENSYAVGEVTGIGTYVGGLLGGEAQSSTITNSFFTDSNNNNGFGTLESSGNSAFYGNLHAVYSEWNFPPWKSNINDYPTFDSILIPSCTSDSDCDGIKFICGIGKCNLLLNRCYIEFNSTEDLCRASTGECDVSEYCSGKSISCPTDIFNSSGTSCSLGGCDGFGTCSIDQCDSDSNCNDNNGCTIDTCSNPTSSSSVCIYSNQALEFSCSVNGQEGGCDGFGNCEIDECDSNIDCNDNNDCTINTCIAPDSSSSICDYDYVDNETACTYNGLSGTCNAVGVCITPDECDSNLDCDDNNDCTINTCLDPASNTSSCEIINHEEGFICIRDGQQGICDIFGNCIIDECDIDVECDDNKDCTIDTCTNPSANDSFCSNIAKPADTECIENGNSGLCDSSGDCIIDSGSILTCAECDQNPDCNRITCESFFPSKCYFINPDRCYECVGISSCSSYDGDSSSCLLDICDIRNCEWDSGTSTCYSCDDYASCSDYATPFQCNSDICSVAGGCEWNYATQICEGGIPLPQLGFFGRIIEGIKMFFKRLF